ncbi:MAG TPA: hypothetical protein VIF09_23095, partial [Polyangiaceae bacterium]
YTLSCNTQAAAQSFTINDSPGVVPYDFSAAVTAGWTVTPASGTVSPGTPFTLTVTPPAVTTGKPASSDNATVTITTDIPGDVAHTVAMAGTLTGGTFNFLNANGAPEPSISWGSTVQGTGSVTTFIDGVGNTSSESVSVVVTAGSGNLAGSALLINGNPSSSWKGTGGSNSVTYSLQVPGNTPCGQTFTYTVTVPSNLPGVCGGASQTLNILYGNSC